MKLTLTVDITNPEGKRTPPQNTLEPVLESEVDNITLWFGDDQYDVTCLKIERA